MKKIFKCSVTLLLIFSGFYYGCQKMDDSYKKFIVPGGLIYPGKVASPMTNSGRERIKVSWLRGADDPSIIKAIVYWNNYTDSVIVNIPDKGDTISTIIENLPEQQYTFEIITLNAKGDKSVPVEVLGASYGDAYQASLLNRPVNRAINYGNDTAWIQWGAADITNGAYATEISYTDTSGNEITKRCPISDTESFVPAINNTDMQYRTVYLPDSTAIDTFYTAYDTYKILTKLDKSRMTITADSYEKTGQLPNGAPAKAIDDDPATYWHTDHTVAPLPGYPHWLAVDLKDTVSLGMVELTSLSGYLTADCTNFTVQGSMDGQTWTDYGSFIQPDVDGPQDFVIDNHPTVRYVRIYMTAGPNYYTHLAELSLYKY